MYIECIFFTYSGAKCESDINECDSAPCQNGGLCRDRVGGFQCQCKPGFVGKNLTANTDLQEQIATECCCLANFICLTTLSWHSCLSGLKGKVTSECGFIGYVGHMLCLTVLFHSAADLFPEPWT